MGLESAAFQRRAKTGGKNVISPPKTQYGKKILNYVFGGFNFLMWIAFILTLVSFLILLWVTVLTVSADSFPTNLWEDPIPRPSTLALPSSLYVFEALTMIPS